VKDPRLFLEHIAESIDLIRDYIEGMSRAEFIAARQVQDAVLRRLEIIGEAVKNMPQNLREEYPAVPWRTMSGLRDVLIHAYFRVDLELVWKTIKVELPKFRNSISKILTDLELRRNSH
jgi:uncharacterized protein with HEPN domain